MLSKTYRLPANVRLSNYKNISFKQFSVKIAKNNLSYPRFAFVISKAVDKRAVVRNRVKREMTKSIERLLGKISNNDFLFIVKKSADEDLEQLERNIEESVLK